MGISRFLNTSGLLALSLVGIAPCMASPITTATFNYTGLPYSVNPDSTDFGSFMTASVTLNCNPCADGAYDFSDPDVLNARIASGQETISLATVANDPTGG